MITQLVWSLVEQHLTPYLHNFNPKTDLSISWWNGSIILNNVELSTSLLSSLCPSRVRVSRLAIGELAFRVPLARFWSQSLVVEVKGVRVVTTSQSARKAETGGNDVQEGDTKGEGEGLSSLGQTGGEAAEVSSEEVPEVEMELPQAPVEEEEQETSPGYVQQVLQGLLRGLRVIVSDIVWEHWEPVTVRTPKAPPAGYLVEMQLASLSYGPAEAPPEYERQLSLRECSQCQHFDHDHVSSPAPSEAGDGDEHEPLSPPSPAHHALKLDWKGLDVCEFSFRIYNLAQQPELLGEMGTIRSVRGSAFGATPLPASPPKSGFPESIVQDVTAHAVFAASSDPLFPVVSPHSMHRSHSEDGIELLRVRFCSLRIDAKRSTGLVTGPHASPSSSSASVSASVSPSSSSLYLESDANLSSDSLTDDDSSWWDVAPQEPISGDNEIRVRDFDVKALLHLLSLLSAPPPKTPAPPSPTPSPVVPPTTAFSPVARLGDSLIDLAQTRSIPDLPADEPLEPSPAPPPAPPDAPLRLQWWLDIPRFSITLIEFALLNDSTTSRAVAIERPLVSCVFKGVKCNGTLLNLGRYSPGQHFNDGSYTSPLLGDHHATCAHCSIRSLQVRDLFTYVAFQSETTPASPHHKPQSPMPHEDYPLGASADWAFDDRPMQFDQGTSRRHHATIVSMRSFSCDLTLPESSLTSFLDDTDRTGPRPQHLAFLQLSRVKVVVPIELMRRVVIFAGALAVPLGPHAHPPSASPAPPSPASSSTSSSSSSSSTSSSSRGYSPLSRHPSQPERSAPMDVLFCTYLKSATIAIPDEAGEKSLESVVASTARTPLVRVSSHVLVFQMDEVRVTSNPRESSLSESLLDRSIMSNVSAYVSLVHFACSLHQAQLQIDPANLRCDWSWVWSSCFAARQGARVFHIIEPFDFDIMVRTPSEASLAVEVICPAIVMNVRGAELFEFLTILERAAEPVTGEGDIQSHPPSLVWQNGRPYPHPRAPKSPPRDSDEDVKESEGVKEEAGEGGEEGADDDDGASVDSDKGPKEAASVVISFDSFAVNVCGGGERPELVALLELESLAVFLGGTPELGAFVALTTQRLELQQPLLEGTRSRGSFDRQLPKPIVPPSKQCNKDLRIIAWRSLVLLEQRQIGGPRSHSRRFESVQFRTGFFSPSRLRKMQLHAPSSLSTAPPISVDHRPPAPEWRRGKEAVYIVYSIKQTAGRSSLPKLKLQLRAQAPRVFYEPKAFEACSKAMQMRGIVGLSPRVEDHLRMLSAGELRWKYVWMRLRALHAYQSLEQRALNRQLDIVSAVPGLELRSRFHRAPSALSCALTLTDLSYYFQAVVSDLSVEVVNVKASVALADPGRLGPELGVQVPLLQLQAVERRGFLFGSQLFEALCSQLSVNLVLPGADQSSELVSVSDMHALVNSRMNATRASDSPALRLDPSLRSCDYVLTTIDAEVGAVRIGAGVEELLDVAKLLALSQVAETPSRARRRSFPFSPLSPLSPLTPGTPGTPDPRAVSPSIAKKKDGQVERWADSIVRLRVRAISVSVWRSLPHNSLPPLLSAQCEALRFVQHDYRQGQGAEPLPDPRRKHRRGSRLKDLSNSFYGGDSMFGSILQPHSRSDSGASELSLEMGEEVTLARLVSVERLRVAHGRLRKSCVDVDARKLRLRHSTLVSRGLFHAASRFSWRVRSSKVHATVDSGAEVRLQQLFGDVEWMQQQLAELDAVRVSLVVGKSDSTQAAASDNFGGVSLEQLVVEVLSPDPDASPLASVLVHLSQVGVTQAVEAAPVGLEDVSATELLLGGIGVHIVRHDSSVVPVVSSCGCELESSLASEWEHDKLDKPISGDCCRFLEAHLPPFVESRNPQCVMDALRDAVPACSITWKEFPGSQRCSVQLQTTDVFFSADLVRVLGWVPSLEFGAGGGGSAGKKAVPTSVSVQVEGVHLVAMHENVVRAMGSEVPMQTRAFMGVRPAAAVASGVTTFVMVRSGTLLADALHTPGTHLLYSASVEALEVVAGTASRMSDPQSRLPRLDPRLFMLVAVDVARGSGLQEGVERSEWDVGVSNVRVVSSKRSASSGGEALEVKIGGFEASGKHPAREASMSRDATSWQLSLDDASAAVFPCVLGHNDATVLRLPRASSTIHREPDNLVQVIGVTQLADLEGVACPEQLLYCVPCVQNVSNVVAVCSELMASMASAPKPRQQGSRETMRFSLEPVRVGLDVVKSWNRLPLVQIELCVTDVFTAHEVFGGDEEEEEFLWKTTTSATVHASLAASCAAPKDGLQPLLDVSPVRVLFVSDNAKDGELGMALDVCLEETLVLDVHAGLVAFVREALLVYKLRDVPAWPFHHAIARNECMFPLEVVELGSGHRTRLLVGETRPLALSHMSPAEQIVLQRSDASSARSVWCPSEAVSVLSGALLDEESFVTTVSVRLRHRLIPTMSVAVQMTVRRHAAPGCVLVVFSSAVEVQDLSLSSPKVAVRARKKGKAARVSTGDGGGGEWVRRSRFGHESSEMRASVEQAAHRFSESRNFRHALRGVLGDGSEEEVGEEEEVEEEGVLLRFRFHVEVAGVELFVHGGPWSLWTEFRQPPAPLRGSKFDTRMGRRLLRPEDVSVRLRGVAVVVSSTAPAGKEWRAASLAGRVCGYEAVLFPQSEEHCLRLVDGGDGDGPAVEVVAVRLAPLGKVKVKVRTVELFSAGLLGVRDTLVAAESLFRQMVLAPPHVRLLERLASGRSVVVREDEVEEVGALLHVGVEMDAVRVLLHSSLEPERVRLVPVFSSSALVPPTVRLWLPSMALQGVRAGGTDRWQVVGAKRLRARVLWWLVLQVGGLAGEVARAAVGNALLCLLSGDYR